MRPPHALLHRLALVLACLVLGLAALSLVLEQSGWLRRIVRAQLVERLGEPLEVGDVRLAWFDAALEIDGIDLGLEQDAVALERVRIVLRAGRGFLPRPALIEVVGGRVLLGSELEARIAALELPEGDGSLARAPAVVLRDVGLALRHPTLGTLPIGRVHVAFESDERGRRRLTGHLQPGLAALDARRAPAPLYLSGDEPATGEFELQVSADGSPFDVEDLPGGPAFDDLRATALRGRLSVVAELRLSLARLTQAEGRVRARLSGASLVPSPNSAPLNNLTLDLDARCAPGPAGSVLDWGAWRALLQLGGAWRGSELEGWAVLGSHAGPGRGARAWLRARDLPLDEETVAALHIPPAGRLTWDALAPKGTADVLVGGELDLAGRPRLTLEVAGDGDLSVAYVGYPPRLGGGKPEGFPMPVHRVHGRVVALFDPQRSPRMQLAILGARGSHTLDAPEERTAWARGQVLSELRLGVEPLWDVRFGGRRIPIDGGGIPLGLRGLSGTDWIWPAFRPAGGEAAFEAAMQHTGGEPGMSAVFRIHAEGTSVVWEQLPLPVADAALDLELRFAPRHAYGIGFRGEGRGVTSDRVRVAGRLWSAPREVDGPPARDPLFEEVSIEVENVSLRGTDRQLLGGRVPEIESLLEQLAAAGKVDVAVRTAGPRAGERVTLTAEVSPREVALSPQAFRVQTRDVRGRVLVTAQSLRSPADDAPEPARVRLAPLVGEWPGGARVACTADVRDGRGGLTFLAAGLEPLNRGLVGALQASVGGAGAAGLDLSALSVDGRVDAHGQVELAPPGERRDADRFSVYLRDNDFRIAPPSGTPEGGGFGLTRLNGVLLQEERELSGSGIRAQLGRTPLVLREARFSLDDDGFRLETRPSARGLPLDREHLRFFLDPGAVDALVDELDFGGALDIDDARLVLAGRAGRAGRVSFQGRVTPRDLHVDLGLPVRVASAAMQIESLVFEAGHVRAWATVDALEGQIAGRRLEAGRLQLTYVEPHLSILDLDATLEGGRLAHLGGAGTAGAPAFSMDLASPFPFDLGLSMADVDVQGLLRGVFESEFASSGLASGELRLTGDLERVRSIRGDGWVSLRDSTLWSIPVMRALFSQLGFDNTAVFERIRTRFAVRDGSLDMDAIGVYSPLLQLVGSGHLDFEGRLHHDLEVRYSLVDSLGPFRRALYWIQNNLLSIAVRGDMSRPRVEISGLLSFLTTAGGGRRDLPLPALTPLPERF